MLLQSISVKILKMKHLILYIFYTHCIVSVLSTPVTHSFPIVERRVQNSWNFVDMLPKVTKQTSRKSIEKCEEYSRKTVWVLPLGGSRPRPIPIPIDCALSTIPLISGGEVVRPGEFPHMAAIGWQLRDGSIGYHCGGSLVSERWVLTAGHCTHHATLGKPRVVRVGANRLSDPTSGLSVRIDRIERHPSYRPPSMYADLALLKLSSPINFTRFARPACLDSQFDKSPNEAWVTGWGSRSSEDEAASDILLKAKLEIVDNVRCSVLHNATSSVPSGVVPSMLCAGDPSGGWHKDTCHGDSGGPLHAPRPDGCTYTLIGVTSFGRSCATPEFPGVYTRVSHYLEWIESVVWPQ